MDLDTFIDWIAYHDYTTVEDAMRYHVVVKLKTVAMVADMFDLSQYEVANRVIAIREEWI